MTIRARILFLVLLMTPATLPAAALSSEVLILGRATGLNGEALKNAKAHLEHIPATYERARLRVAGHSGPEPTQTVGLAGDGTFELKAPEAGMWKVVVTAPGHLAMEHRLVPLVNEAILPTVAMVRADEFRIQLVNAAGEPVPGEVGVIPLEGRGPWLNCLRLAQADENGVAIVPKGWEEKIQIEALANGYPLTILETEEKKSIRMRLAQGVAGKAQLLDSRGRPVTDAALYQGTALLPLSLADEQGLVSFVLQAVDPMPLKVMSRSRWHGTFPIAPASLQASDEIQEIRLDPPLVVSGRIFDATNQEPLAEALVWATRGEWAVTDERGRYDLEMGAYQSRWIRSAAVGYNPEHRRMNPSGGEVPSMALIPIAGVSGRVIDENGDPINGVAVSLRVLPGTQVPASVRRLQGDGWNGTTSEKGFFGVSTLPSGLSYELNFRAEGFAPKRLEIGPLEPREQQSEIEVVLTPGRVAYGWVVDEGESPVAGATVQLHRPPSSSTMSYRRRSVEDEEAVPSTLTDAEGRYELQDLGVGLYNLVVRAAGLAPASIPGLEIPDGPPEMDFGTVVLVEGATLEGQVTDADGDPVANAEVSVREEQQMMIMAVASERAVQTNATGQFVVDGLRPEQPVSISVKKEGYGTYGLNLIRPPLEEPLAIELLRSVRFTGRVVNEEGLAVEGARVMVGPDYRQGRSVASFRRGSARTEQDGRFAIEGVSPGIVQVIVAGEGYQRLEQNGIEVDANTNMDLVLKRGALVEGTVTYADGEPVGGANVSINQDTSSVWAGSQTDFEGRYRVEGAPLGLVSIHVHHGNGELLSEKAEIKAGANLIDLKAERGFKISGQVMTEDGTPVRGATLSLQHNEEGHSSSTSWQEATDGNGSFSLGPVKPGTYQVTASVDGFADASSDNFEVNGDVEGIFLEVRPGAVLKGRILGLELDDLSGMMLIASGGRGHGRRGQVNFAGEYVIRDLAPGAWYISARTSANRNATASVEIPEGVTEVTKDIEFIEGLTLRGLVMDGDEPIAGAMLNIIGKETNGHGTSGHDGRFMIEGLPAGSYHLMVMTDGRMQHTEPLELVNDQEVRIEIATGSILAYVRDGQGEPVSGATVGLTQMSMDAASVFQGNFTSQSMTDANGVARMPRVQRGTWRLVASQTDYAPSEATVEVIPGVESEVELQLVPSAGVTLVAATASGSELRSIRAVLLDASGRRLTGGTYDAVDGKIRIPSVPAGPWDLVVQGGTSATVRVRVTAPGEQAVVLPEGGRLQIHVPALEDVPMANLTLTDPEGQPYFSAHASFGPGRWILSRGRAYIDHVLPGEWSFTAEHDGQSWSGRATVTAGGTSEAQLP